jgi:hypothetical protein
MARMEISFSLDNDAFRNPDTGDLAGYATVAELDRIFQRISDAVWEGNTEGRIRDSNGNTVGQWEIGS